MSKYTITHSTELMQNYLQATAMSPEKDFRALQKSDGGALLFSIGSDGSFNVTAEAPGKSHAWYSPMSLSQDYPGAACLHFAVAQRADNSIQMAMVLRETKNNIPNDQLYLGYLSLPQSGEIKPPKWTAFPYDDPKTSRPKVEIAGILISEATDGEYIVADVVRDPNSPTKEIVRYYIDSARDGGYAWHPHDVPTDIESEKYTSVLGRKDGAGVDGIYTSGQIDNSPQIIYTPLFNELRRNRHPIPTNLKLTGEGNLVADAIAVCPNSDNTTDLYATAKGVLYRFASTFQENNNNDVIASVATSNLLFTEVKDLFAFAYADSVMVWGRNADNAVFYTTCLRSQVNTPAAWSVPLPIMSGVQQVAPFMNRANSANTFFAHTEGNELKIAVKSPEKNGRWDVSDVHLPPPSPKAKAKSFKSYTTHVKVVGPNNQPMSGEKVSISTAKESVGAGVTSVYINHLYYIVGPTPIHVDPDPTGSITIVEAVSRLDGTQFDVSVVGDDGNSKHLNPMQDAPTVNTQLRKLKTADGLVEATIHYQNEKINPPRKLVRAAKRNAKDADVKTAAANIDYLWQAHDHLTKTSERRATLSLPADHLKKYAAFVGDKQPIVVDAGDLLSMLESRKVPAVFARHHGVTMVSGESWWEVFVSWLKGAWHFIVKIGEAIFAFVIEVIEDVYAAFKYVFNKIVETIEDVIEFVKFLFSLGDLQRTKDVFQHVTTLFLQDQVTYISTVRKDFDTWVESLIKEINDWANMNGNEFNSLKPMTEQINQLQSANQPAPASASDSFLAYHFANNVQDALQEGAVTAPDGSLPLLAKLEVLVKQEVKTLCQAVNDLYALSTNFEEKRPEDVLKKVIAILAKVVLKSFEALIDALLTAVEHLAQWALDLFTKEPLYIPVVSEILAEFGVSDFTVSDVVSWLAAIPLTIGYKIVTGTTPFPDDELTTFLSNAPDFESVVKRLQDTTHPEAILAAQGTVKGNDSPAHRASGALHITSSILSAITGVCGVFEALAYKNGKPIVPSYTAFIGFMGAVDNASRFSALAIVPRAPFRDPNIKQVVMGLRAFTLVHKMLFGSVSVANGFGLEIAGGFLGAGTDVLLVAAQTTYTAGHLYEISRKPVYRNDENLAIVDEVSNICTYLARLSRDFLIVDSVDPIDPEVKAGFAATFAAARFAQSLFQLGEGVAELTLDWPA